MEVLHPHIKVAKRDMTPHTLPHPKNMSSEVKHPSKSLFNAEPGKIICGTFLWPLEQNWWSYCAIVSTGTLTQCTFFLYPDYALHDGESSC